MYKKLNLNSMLITKDKVIKIVLIIIVFIIVDVIASSFYKLGNITGAIGYLLSYSMVLVYGLYLVKNKDDFAIKSFFYIVLILSVLNILARVIDNL